MQGLIHTGHMTHTLPSDQRRKDRVNFDFPRFWQYNFCSQRATFGYSVTSLGRSITVRAQVLAATHQKRDKV